MKKTQLKDGLRNIRKQIVSYISIIVIAAIGATTFLCIDYTSSAMLINGSRIYNRLNYRDLEIISTLLFTESDLEQIRNVEGVADAEPVRYTSAEIRNGGLREKVSVISVTERINVPEISEGRLPESASECAVEQSVAEKLGLAVGDGIVLSDSKDGAAEFMSRTDFVISGIVKHPDHINRIVPDLLYVIVTWDAFGSEELGDCYMRTEVAVEKPDNVNRFSSGYLNTVSKVTAKTDALAAERTEIRNGSVFGQANEEIEKNQKLIDDAEKKLSDARKELDEKTKEYEQGVSDADEAEKQLAEAKPLIDEGWIKLESGRLQLEDAKSALDSAKIKIDSSKSELDYAALKLSSGKKRLENGFAQLENAKELIRATIRKAYETAFKEDSGNKLVTWAKPRAANVDDPAETASYLWLTENIRLDLSRPLEEIFRALVYAESVPEKLLVAVYEVKTGKKAPVKDGEYDYRAIRESIVTIASDSSDDYKKLADACAEWNKGHDEYIAGLNEYNKGVIEYEAGVEQFNAAQKQYDEGLKAYRENLALYNEKKEEYDKGAAELSEGRKKLEEGKILLEDGEKRYAEGMTELEDGKENLAEAREKVESLDKCRWIALDVNGNASCVQLSSASGNFSKLKSTFSLMFVVVAALVIFATVGKMVDEQRTLVGTEKALGFFSREIFVKYLGFGVSAAVIGTVIGVFIARFAAEPFLLGTFGLYYRFDVTTPTVTLVPTAVVFAAGVLLASAAVWFACVKLLREPAVRLMQPKAPGVKKGAGGNSSLPLYTRLILLNMRMDLKRVVVTIVSVAGCCALIIIGITIKTSIDAVPERQYGEIMKFDLLVTYDPSYSDGAKDGVEAVLKEAGTEYTDVFKTDLTYNIGKLQTAELYCADLKKLGEFYRMDDIKTNKPLYPTNEGVFVQRRASEVYGLDTNSEFEIALGGVKTATVRVAGVFESYFGSTVAMSPQYYEAVFGKECTPNTFIVRLNGADADKLTAALSETGGFESVSRADTGRSLLKESSSSVNTVVVLFIFIAGVMAGVVLLNLTNMYILQKKRELTIMRVNGFTVKEVIGYVLRETVLTTVLGIILGIAVGSVAAYSIIRTLEQALIRFERGVNPFAWLIAALLTVVFTVIVNVIALRKVKRLKLTDAA